MPKRLHLEKFGPVHALPVLHNRMECAWLVRQAMHEIMPDCVALELPAGLEAQFVRAAARLPQISAIRYSMHPKATEEQVEWLLVEPADAFAEAGRMAIESDIPLRLIDLDTGGYPAHQEALPDPYAIHRIGLGAYYHAFCEAQSLCKPGPEDLLREQGMTLRLQQLGAQYKRILFVCGMSHLQRIKDAFSCPQATPMVRSGQRDASLFNLHPDSCRELLGEFPFLSAIYEHRRHSFPDEPDDAGSTIRRRFSAFELIQGGKKDLPEEQLLDHAILRAVRHSGPEGSFPDRQRIIMRLFMEAARHYRQETGEVVHHWQKRAFFKYVRNYAAVSGMLLPDLYQILVASRGCIDDNFAYAVHRLAARYPWQREDTDIQTIRLEPEDLWDGTRKIRFRPKEQRRKGLSQFGFLHRRKEKKPGEWLEGFDDPSVCSWPPEDVSIEQYGEFLKKKGTILKAEEQARVEPFTSSLLDGIDLKETLRNIHDGRIYVRETRRGNGDVGVVVVIFDEDKQNRNYPYMTTWLGEHDQESDMAFYATRPEDNIVGPGICRCEYGGFMLSYPPRRLDDIWTDPDYRYAGSKSELLLMAALDYTREKQVVYVAARPPRSIFRQLAARMGRSIIYIPIGSLSPVTLKKLRVMHILSGKDKRQSASEYIW
ncbi:MAG: hypothetical protein PHN92_04975 [Geobacter sp.]|nr:hypothetical protein [Geobacter sp.]